MTDTQSLPHTTAQPDIVSAQEWGRARADLLVAEKAATRLLDRLAAQRRRLPMVAFRSDYQFAGDDGSVSLLDLFDGQPQLALYQFMNAGPDHLCPGCSAFTNNVVALDAIREAGVSWATVSDMPLAQIEAGKAEHGWSMPFVSSADTSFAADCGVEGGFMFSLFLRRGDDVYRTYTTEQRGVDRLMFLHNILDLAVYGRQEAWEDSPANWPQS
jgi:predicted dithiol-disulfide oxidoreductase (DUF899 family)